MYGDAVLDLGLLALLAAILYFGHTKTHLGPHLESVNRFLGVQYPYGVAGIAVVVVALWVVGSSYAPDSRHLVVGTISLAAIGAGGVGIAVGLSNRDRWTMIDDGEGVGSRSTTDDGIVVSGTVTVADGTVEAPLSGHEAVCYVAEVSEKSGLKRRWLFRDRWVERRRFYVSGPTGEVLVNPEGAWVLLERRTTGDVTGSESHHSFRFKNVETFSRGDDIDQRLADELDERPTVTDPKNGTIGETTVVREATLKPGDEVTVVGHASGTAGPEGYLETEIGDGGDRCFVVAEPLDEATETLRFRGRTLLIGGGAAVVAGVAFSFLPGLL